MIEFPLYSPVEMIDDALFAEKQVRVFIKRDDLIHPFISGNKWRKLKYITKKAEAENRNHLVTFGGAWSNHLLATACAAAKFGFKSTGIVRGEEIRNNLLDFCRLFGMDLQFIDRESYRDKKNIFKDKFSNQDNSFFIDEGGASPEGVLGCSELIAELGSDYDHIFCACGTGTTAAGIINGLKQNKLATRFHGISVLKNAEFLRSEIDKYLNNEVNYELHTDYHFGGYAKTSPVLIQFIKNFTARTGILIDPVYTGKMMYAVYDLVRTNQISEGDSILVIHTGGLFGLLGMQDAFS